MKPFFSVVVPCYNVEKSITPTLKALESQTFDNWELILVNDGSTDETLKILKNFKIAAKTIIVNQKNKGLGGARNEGIKRANGKFIALLDADDTWNYNKLEFIHNYLLSNPYSDLVCHNEKVLKFDGQWIKNNVYGPWNSFLDLYFKGNCLSPSSSVIKKDIFERGNYFSEKRTFHGVEDYDFWLRLALKNHKFSYVSDYLGNYIMHENNMSGDVSLFSLVEEKLLLKYATEHNLMVDYKGKLLLRFIILYIRRFYYEKRKSNQENILFLIKSIFQLFTEKHFFQNQLKRIG